jgi:hypothetical protein
MSRSLVGRAVVALVLTVFGLAFAPRSLAAPGDVLFADDFVLFDSSFGEPTAAVSVADNQLVVKLDKQQWYRLPYQSMIYNDVDATVRVQMPSAAAPTGAGLGLMFWTSDFANSYVFEISDHGTYAVRRITPDLNITHISWRTSDAINTQPGAWNELRVVTHGDRATVFINGQELATLRGRVPQGGSLVGLFAESFDAASEGRFMDLKVAEPGPAPANLNLAASDPAMILVDDFTAIDPAWGAPSDWMTLRDGQLSFSFEPSQSVTSLNLGAIVTGDADITVTARTTGAVGDVSNDAAAGLVFWAKDYANYHLFQVMDDGTMIVFRRIGDRWLTPMAVKEVPAAAKFDLTAGAELRVVTSGRRATLFINGVEVGVISGQPPANESSIGLYAQSGDAAGNTLFDNLTIRRVTVQ